MRFLYTFHEYIKKMRFSFYMDIFPEQTGHKRFRPGGGIKNPAKTVKFLIKK